MCMTAKHGDEIVHSWGIVTKVNKISLWISAVKKEISNIIMFGTDHTQMVCVSEHTVRPDWSTSVDDPPR